MSAREVIGENALDIIFCCGSNVDLNLNEVFFHNKQICQILADLTALKVHF